MCSTFEVIQCLTVRCLTYQIWNTARVAKFVDFLVMYKYNWADDVLLFTPIRDFSTIYCCRYISVVPCIAKYQLVDKWSVEPSSEFKFQTECQQRDIKYILLVHVYNHGFISTMICIYTNYSMWRLWYIYYTVFIFIYYVYVVCTVW